MRPVGDTVHLTKHHGLGNDFLLLVDLHDLTPVGAATARWLCDRRRGVGADGFIRVAPPPAGGDGAGADVAMTLRNADGGEAEMSGNGIRCLGQAVARHRGVTSLDLTVATAGGVRELRVRPGPPHDPATAWVDVDMGPARPGTATWVTTVELDATKVVTVDMGNPHLVLLVDDPAGVDLAELGPRLSAQFDHGSNVEVIRLAAGAEDTLELRVWERGVGLTQACGTGACAAAHAAHDWGLVGERVRVRMLGGEVDVTLGATVALAGPATFVADIEVRV
ncbi:MAG: diaminopimelate epimerase [Actinobacteria bacterium]|nr:diaminopimelate epimerase [Actinomycetota bacterium]